MSKVQDYLKNKYAKENLPLIYIVKSTRDGVELPVQLQVIEIIENVAIRISGKERLPIDRYKLEVSPYQVDILRGESSSKDDGYGTGFGDLWEWSFFSSFSKEEIENYYQEESIRVKNIYFS